MQNVTVRLPEELIDRLDTEAEERDASRSEYIRQILSDRHKAGQLEGEIDTLQEELKRREQRISTLEEQLARRSQLEDRIEDMEVELREDRQDRNAPFFVKWYKWFRE